MFGAVDPNSALHVGPDPTPWLADSRKQATLEFPNELSSNSISPRDADVRLGQLELTGDLVAHLLACKPNFYYSRIRNSSLTPL